MVVVFFKGDDRKGKGFFAYYYVYILMLILLLLLLVWFLSIWTHDWSIHDSYNLFR